MRANGLSLVLVGLVGCGGGDVDVDVASSGEKSLVEYGVLSFVNGSEATGEVLDLEATLDVRAAYNIASRVRGADGKHGTLDDRPFVSLADLDGVPYVGPSALTKLIDYVEAIGAMPELMVEGVYFTRLETEATLFVVNYASGYELDVEADLDARAVSIIVDYRPFVSIEEIAAVPFLGTVSLAKLRDYAVAYVLGEDDDGREAPDGELALPLEAPIPAVLEWINDYQAPAYVSRVFLKADGSYEAAITGEVEAGAFYGPRSVGEITGPGINLRLVSSSGDEWSMRLGMYSLDTTFTRDGRTGVLLPTLETPGEGVCMDGGGQWLDDDPNADGLYCGCPNALPYIPAQGGCIGVLRAERIAAIEAEVRSLITRNDWMREPALSANSYEQELFRDGSPDGATYFAYLKNGPGLDVNTVELVWIERRDADSVKSASVMVPIAN